MKDLEHKGFIGSIEFDDETNTLWGKVKFIKGLITYESVDGTIPSLITEFNNAVDEYLEDCQELGLKPQTSATGIFQVRVTPELHYKANVRASAESTSLNSLVKTALTQYLEDHYTRIISSTINNALKITSNVSNFYTSPESTSQIPSQSLKSITMSKSFSAPTTKPGSVQWN